MNGRPKGAAEATRGRHPEDDLVRSQLASSGQFKMSREEVCHRFTTVGDINSGNIEFRSHAAAHDLATRLSLACENSEDVAIGLTELMVNAIEHGNLGIGFDLKSNLLQVGEMQPEVKRRLNAPENIDKTVAVHFARREDYIEFCIADQGNGFDAAKFMDIQSINPQQPHGRGIWLARSILFDRIQYLGSGNVVCALIRTK